MINPKTRPLLFAIAASLGMLAITLFGYFVMEMFKPYTIVFYQSIAAYIIGGVIIYFKTIPRGAWLAAFYYTVFTLLTIGAAIAAFIHFH